MDQMDDESWQKWVPIMENNDWHIFSDFDMNSAGEELKEDDSSVDPEEVSWKENTATLLTNFLSLEENTAFHMPSLTQQASPHKPQTCVLSFEDSTSVPTVAKKTCQPNLGEQPKQTQEEKPHHRKSLKRERTSPQTVDHILTERKRRENITRMFIALAALIPGLKKMDKVSVLSNAVEYVKYLQQRVKDLEKEKQQKRKIESAGCLKLSKTNMVAYDISWSSHVYDGAKTTKKCSKVEARVAGKDVLIRVTCEMQKNIVRDVMAKLQAHNLSILCSNVLPFGNSALAITTIAEMNPKFTMAVEDLVKKLNDDLSKCCSLQY